MKKKYLLIIVLLVFPLFLINMDTGSFRGQTLLLLILAAALIISCILNGDRKLTNVLLINSHLKLVVYMILGYQLLYILGKLFSDPALGAISFDAEMLIIALAIFSLVYMDGVKFPKYYFELLLYSGLVVFVGLLYRYLCNSEFARPIGLIANDSSAIASYTLMICILSVWCYCRCGDRLHSLFYAGTAIIGFMVLIINNHILSIWIITGVFIAIPVLFRPTAELVRRDMQMLFIFCLLLSNMSLITNYTGIIQADLQLSLERSVYLDMIFAITAFFFFGYWERIPRNVDLRKLVVVKMRRGYQLILRAFGIIFAGFIIGGDRWKQLPDGIMLSAVKNFAIPLVESVKQSKSMFVTCLEHQGLIGTGMILIFLILMITKIQKNFSFDKPITGFFILISDVFLIQMLFWTPAINSLPIYFIFFLLAAFYKEDRERVTCIKFKQEGGDYGKE